MRTEARADVLEREERDACSSGGLRDGYDQVSRLPLERPVLPRSPAREADRPIDSGTSRWEQDRRRLSLPRCHSLLHKEYESPVTARHEQSPCAGGVAAEEGDGETPSDLALHRLRRRLHWCPSAASRAHERNQQAPDETGLQSPHWHASNTPQGLRTRDTPPDPGPDSHRFLRARTGMSFVVGPGWMRAMQGRRERQCP